MAEARNCAAPAGVRSTTRLALASAEVSSSLRYRTRRELTAPAGRPAGWPPADSEAAPNWSLSGPAAVAVERAAPVPRVAAAPRAAVPPPAAVASCVAAVPRVAAVPGADVPSVLSRPVMAAGGRRCLGWNGRGRSQDNPFGIIQGGTGVVAGVSGERVDQGAVGGAQAHHAELVQVARQGGLGDVHARVLSEQAGQLLLRVDLLAGEYGDDPRLARRLGPGGRLAG